MNIIYSKSTPCYKLSLTENTYLKEKIYMRKPITQASLKKYFGMAGLKEELLGVHSTRAITELLGKHLKNCCQS